MRTYIISDSRPDTLVQVADGVTAPQAARSNGFIDGAWHEAGNEEITELKRPKPGYLARAVRRKRTELIAETDYFMQYDYPASAADRADVSAYRQLLRDVTSQADFPQSVVWPDIPVCLK
jgi:hypothetical protein